MRTENKILNKSELLLDLVKNTDKQKHSEEYFVQICKQSQLIINSVAEGILGLDLKGNHTFFNQSAINMLGFTHKEFVNGHSHNLWHHTKPNRNTFPEKESPIYATIRNGEKHRISSEVFWRKDGTNFPVEYTSSPNYENDKVIGAVVTFLDITERKKTELDLHESEEKLRSIMENSPDAIFMVNEQGRFVYTNRAVSLLLGFSPEEMKEKSIADTAPACKAEEYFKLFKKIFSEGKIYAEIELLRNDGSIIRADLNSVLLPNGLVYASFRDITRRKQLEENILRFKQGIELSPDAVFMTNPQGEITYTNSSFEKMYGYSMIETVGKTPRILKSNVLTPEVYKSFWTNLLNNEIVSGEIVNKTKDGRLITIDCTNNPILDATGKNIGFLGIHRDITERKKTELALQESEEKLRSIMENSPDAIFMVNPQGKYIYTNKAVTLMLGYTSEDMKNKTLADISPPNKIEEYYGMFKTIHSKESLFTEIELLKSDGNYISTDLNAVLLPDGITFASCRDITERKVTTQNLKESETRLVQLNADKDRFIAILGHDLKNPFGNILSLSEILVEDLRKVDINEIETIANQIYSTAQNTSELLEEILVWARTQQGSISFKPQFLNLRDICSNVLEILKQTASTKDIIINYSAPDKIKVYADIDMLKTILRNIISNAIKFTKKGGVININADENSGDVRISVSDTGVGISDDNLKKLFDIAQIVTTKGTSKENGTGLGLLICKEFVETHGGKIWVESKVEQGSSFHFTIPYPNRMKKTVSNCR